MEIPLTNAQEAQLNQIAQQQGTNVTNLLMQAATSQLQSEQHFLAKLDRALAQVARGEFIEEEEMDARFAKLVARL